MFSRANNIFDKKTNFCDKDFLVFWEKEQQSFHKKWSFPLRNSLVNKNKSAVSCWSSQIYSKNIKITKLGNFIFYTVSNVIYLVVKMKFFGFLCKRTALTLQNNSRTYVINVVLSFNNSVTCAIFHKKVELLVTNHFRIHTGLYKGKIYIVLYSQ